jgi:hypothetical protein
MAILKAGIQNVGFDWRWWEIFEDDESTLGYLLFGMEYDIFLQDGEGTDFRTFLVTLLSFFWKRNVRRMPRTLKSVEFVLF